MAIIAIDALNIVVRRYAAPMRYHAVSPEVLEHSAHRVHQLATVGYTPVVAALGSLLPDTAASTLTFEEARDVVAKARGKDHWHDLVSAAEIGHEEVLVTEEIVFAREAIDAGDPERLAGLLMTNPGMATEVTDKDLPLLHHAAAPSVDGFRVPGQMRMVELLLEAGADVDGRGLWPWGGTALMQAVSVNNLQITERLLRAGADLEAAGSVVHAGTALCEAVFYSMREVAELLVAWGAEVYSLPLAAAMGDQAQVEAFWGEPWTHPDRSFGDPTDPAPAALSLAAMNGRLDQVGWLLDQGVDVNARFEIAPFEGASTALIRASDAGFGDVVDLLLQRGADLDGTDSEFGGTALGHCVWSATEGFPHLSPAGRNHLGVAKRLRQAGAPVSAWALEQAQGHQHRPLIKLLSSP
jgi:hypothetical protein